MLYSSSITQSKRKRTEAVNQIVLYVPKTVAKNRLRKLIEEHGLMEQTLKNIAWWGSFLNVNLTWETADVERIRICAIDALFLAKRAMTEEQRIKHQQAENNFIDNVSLAIGMVPTKKRLSYNIRTLR